MTLSGNVSRVCADDVAGDVVVDMFGPNSVQDPRPGHSPHDANVNGSDPDASNAQAADSSAANSGNTKTQNNQRGPSTQSQRKNNRETYNRVVIKETFLPDAPDLTITLATPFGANGWTIGLTTFAGAVAFGKSKMTDAAKFHLDSLSMAKDLQALQSIDGCNDSECIAIRDNLFLKYYTLNKNSKFNLKGKKLLMYAIKDAESYYQTAHIKPQQKNKKQKDIILSQKSSYP